MSSVKQAALNNQQLRFVEEYLIDPSSVTKAAKRAGYSLATAAESGSRLLADSRVKDMIAKAQDHRAKLLGITTERVLQELALIAFATADGLTTTDEDGDVSPNMHGIASQSPGQPTELIVSSTKGGKSKVKTVTVKSVKLADKIAALLAMGKHMGMFVDKVEVSGKLNLLDLIEKSYSEEPKQIKQIEPPLLEVPSEEVSS